jgi:hypothetical protein
MNQNVLLQLLNCELEQDQPVLLLKAQGEKIYSRCSSLLNTTCLLVSSISPARKISSMMAYTCEEVKGRRQIRWSDKLLLYLVLTL